MRKTRMSSMAVTLGLALCVFASSDVWGQQAAGACDRYVKALGDLRAYSSDSTALLTGGVAGGNSGAALGATREKGGSCDEADSMQNAAQGSAADAAWQQACPGYIEKITEKARKDTNCSGSEAEFQKVISARSQAFEQCYASGTSAGGQAAAAQEASGTFRKFMCGAKKALPAMLAGAALGALAGMMMGKKKDDKKDDEKEEPAPAPASESGAEAPAEAPKETKPSGAQACFVQKNYPNPKDRTACLCALDEYKTTKECQKKPEVDNENSREPQSQEELDGLASLEQASQGAITQVTEAAPTDGPEFRPPSGGNVPNGAQDPFGGTGSESTVAQNDDTSSDDSTGTVASSGGDTTSGGAVIEEVDPSDLVDVVADVSSDTSASGGTVGATAGNSSSDFLNDSGTGLALAGRGLATLAEKDPCQVDPKSKECKIAAEKKRQELLKRNSQLLSE